MRWVWTLVLVLVVLGQVAIVRADDTADRQEAAREFAAGQAADRKRDWPTAIQHYVRANDLVPHPNAMFNIATDYEKLGNLRQAAVWYQRYVEAAPEASDRARILSLIRDLAVRPSTLTVRTIPAGARVLIDGLPAGTTPYSGKIKGGPHRVTFEHEGRREHRDISVDFGEPAVLDLTLRGESGTLRVDGPPGAILSVDGLPAGSLPTTLELPPGPHRIRVTSYGYAPFETTTTVAPDRETVVEARMARALGTIDGGTRTIKAGYLFGFGGGVDVRGQGVVALLDLGVQALRYDAAVRIGKAGGATTIDFVARWTIGDGRLAPYVGGGLAIVLGETDEATGASGSSSTGYALIGGLRFSLSKGDHTALALIAESGLRWTPTTTSATDAGQSALIVPVMASLQVIYK